ncbi:MAG: glycosyltransferase family 39 protein [Acidobacteriaceae bacterium]
MAIESNRQVGVARGKRRKLVRLLLVLSAVVYGLGFLHLRANFPSGSPWMDASKLADEGWYAGAAIHYFVQGRWYLPGLLNPVVAMPVWPTMLGVWFYVTNVSMLSARVLTMLLYGVSLVLLYQLMWRARPGRVAAVVVLLTVIDPLCYAFNRLAILEPVTVLWLLLALWIAGETGRADWLKQVLLGVVIALLVLTRAAGVVLVPAVVYMLWASWGWTGRGKKGIGNEGIAKKDGGVARDVRWWRGLAATAVVLGVAGAMWEGYVRLLVWPHHARDYALMASLHAQHVRLAAMPGVAWQVLQDGGWIGPVLFWMAVVVVVLSAVWLRELWKRPLFGAAVIAVVGQMAYVCYRGEMQPRYFAVMAMPVMIVAGLGVGAIVDRRRLARRDKRMRWAERAAVLVLLAGVGMMAAQTVGYVMHPDYSYWEAAEGIGSIVEADGGAKPMILSDSGDDMTLWTGVPAVSASMTTDGLDPVLDRYKPGWYAAWPGWQDATVAQLETRYRLDAVARYRVFDDPTRQTLVLYKMTPR